MAKFLVRITYTSEFEWSEEKKQLFDPAKNPDNRYEREYTTTVTARNAHEAFQKVLASRREVRVEKRIFPHTVVRHEVHPLGIISKPR